MNLRAKTLLTLAGKEAAALGWKLYPAPNFHRIQTIGELGRGQPRVRFDATRASIEGWLTPAEQPPPLALGIADSGVPKEFLTRESNPTLASLFVGQIAGA